MIAAGELQAVVLPDQHSAGSVQIAHCGAVVVWNVLREYAGAVGSAYASRGIDILDRVRYAVQRPAILPLRYLLLRLLRGCQRSVTQHGKECVQFGVERVNAIKDGLRKLNR